VVKFQSSPGLVTGRYQVYIFDKVYSFRFQSSPGLVTGRYHTESRCSNFGQFVSILARSGDRALRSRALEWRRYNRFQSSPGLVTGRYYEPGCYRRRVFRFQSSPGLVTGRYVTHLGPVPTLSSFNPRPVW